MNVAYLLLGSNEGNRLNHLKKATEKLNCATITIEKKSKLYETAAWGMTEQPDFLNCVLEIRTTLQPEDLLIFIQQIELDLGRQRRIKWGQRTLDIDLLFYDKIIMQTPSLALPHPYLHLRRFTLLPMVEIASQWVHPVLKKTMATLLMECPDTLEARVFSYLPL